MSIIVRPSREHTIALVEELMLKMHFAANEEILVQVEEDRLVLSKKTGSYMKSLGGCIKKYGKASILKSSWKKRGSPGTIMLGIEKHANTGIDPMLFIVDMKRSLFGHTAL